MHFKKHHPLRGYAVTLLVMLLFYGADNQLRAQEPPSRGSQEAVEDSVALDRHVRLALKNSPRLEALFRLYHARLEQLPQVGTLPDPELMFQYHINPMEENNPLSGTTVTARQMFPWFGTLGKRKEQVEKLSRVQWSAFEEARNKLVLEVSEQWYRMHELQHHILIFTRNLKLLERLENQVRSQYESGQASQVDLLRLQIRQDELEIKIENSSEELGSMKAGFNALLDRNPDAEVDIPQIMFSRRVSLKEDELRELVRSRNPRLRGREYEEEAALAAEEQARMEGLPSFGVGVMVMNRNFMYMPLMAGDGPAVTASLSVRLPIYRSKYRGQQEEARLEARAAREEQRDITNRMDARVESLLQQYRETARTVLLYEDRLIPRVRQAMEVALAEYASGRAVFEQIIELQQQLLDYEMKQNTASVEQNIAVAKLHYISGGHNATPEEIEPDNQ